MLEKRIFLKKPKPQNPRFGHPWIYRSQIDRISGDPQPGDLVEVHTGRNRLGIGYYNSASEISVRLLSSRSNLGKPIDKGFFKVKIEKALEFRKKVVRQTNAFRVVYGEADGLPGLIVDRYDEVLVVQFLTLGMDRLRPVVLEALNEVLPSRGVYEKSDSGTRRLEGLPEKTGWIERNCGEETVIDEKDVRFGVRFGRGHKTGLYLDQRDNRFLFRELGVKGKVLDAFCYEGGFGLHLAAGGASRVLGIDIQKEAVEAAERNRELNRMSGAQVEFKAANAFDELKALERARTRFDFIILDPPSFVKKKAAVEGAFAGYKEILLRSMKILNEGGLLAVFSCSYHLDENLLMQASLNAALDTRRSLRVLKFLKQSADHPIDPFIPETYYLKGFLFEVGSPA